VWLAEDHLAAFYTLKAVLSLVATVLLVVHMQQAFTEALTWGRRLRYLVLLYFAITLTGVSVGQMHSLAAVDWRTVIGFGGAVLLILAAGLSIFESRKP
jgi:hypothetical protein